MIKQLYTVEDITVKEYFELLDKSYYDIYFEAMNPSNFLCGKSCNTSKLTFDEVEVMKGVFNEPNYNDLKDLFIELFDIKGSMAISSENIFLKQSVFDLFRAHNFLTEFILNVSKTEKKLLTAKKDEKLLMINATNRLSAVSHLLTKISLAEQFSTTPKEIGKWKYSEILFILVANDRLASVRKDYKEIT